MITADEIELYAAQISQLYFDKTRDAAKLIGHLDGADADAVLDRAIDIDFSRRR